MKESTEQKIQVLIVLILIGVALIFKFIPEYQNSKGSSDSYIDSSTYDDIIEIKIDNKPNFAIITENDSISGILFFDKESLCIYNQNIESRSIEDGVSEIVELLIENNYLKVTSTITFTKYINTTTDSVTNAFINKLNSMGLAINYQQITSTLKEKAISLNISETETSEIITQLDYYSKEIIRHYKNDISTSSDVTTTNFTEELAKTYANNVYIKIENYALENNITNQEVNNTSLPINLIPANQSGTIYPDKTSWYYIQDSKVYAYISFTQDNKNYSYCYQASIDEYKEGQC